MHVQTKLEVLLGSFKYNYRDKVYSPLTPDVLLSLNDV